MIKTIFCDPREVRARKGARAFLGDKVPLRRTMAKNVRLRTFQRLIACVAACPSPLLLEICRVVAVKNFLGDIRDPVAISGLGMHVAWQSNSQTSRSTAGAGHLYYVGYFSGEYGVRHMPEWSRCDSTMLTEWPTVFNTVMIVLKHGVYLM